MDFVEDHEPAATSCTQFVLESHEWPACVRASARKDVAEGVIARCEHHVFSTRACSETCRHGSGSSLRARVWWTRLTACSVRKHTVTLFGRWSLPTAVKLKRRRRAGRRLAIATPNKYHVVLETIVRVMVDAASGAHLNGTPGICCSRSNKQPAHRRRGRRTVYLG